MMRPASEYHDTLCLDRVRRLCATIGLDATVFAEGGAAPLLGHWLSFLPTTASDELGPDGHPSRAADPLAADFPRRMWAGSSITFHRPLRIGTALTRRTTYRDPEEKLGRGGGRLLFQSVDHAVADADGPVLQDTHNIVYRPSAQLGEASPAPKLVTADAEWERRVQPDPILLFRYSALTFNAHRIHYDRPYAIEREGYYGLVVHGPLIATLLLHELIARHPGIDVCAYRFRAVRPLIDTGAFFVCGSLGGDGVARLFARDESGALCMDATATLR